MRARCAAAAPRDDEGIDAAEFAVEGDGHRPRLGPVKERAACSVGTGESHGRHVVVLDEGDSRLEPEDQDQSCPTGAPCSRAARFIAENVANEVRGCAG